MENVIVGLVLLAIGIGLWFIHPLVAVIYAVIVAAS